MTKREAKRLAYEMAAGAVRAHFEAGAMTLPYSHDADSTSLSIMFEWRGIPATEDNECKVNEALMEIMHSLERKGTQ